MTPSPRDAERPRAGETRTSGETRPSGAAPLIPDGLDAVLVLLRHGETEFIVDKRFQGQMEAPLSKAGELQARLAGRRLASPHDDPPLPIPDGAPFAIVHSPLGRARRTAEYVVEAMAAAGAAAPRLRPEPGLSEIAQGDWEGLTDSEITAQFGDSLAGWRRWPTRFHAPGGEDLDQVQSRVQDALAYLLGDLAAGGERGTLDRNQVLGYEEKAVDRRRWALVVGHGGVFRVVTCVLLGLPAEHFWNFDFGLAAISIIEIRAGRAVLRALNLDAHLGSEAAQIAADAAERNAGGAL